MARYRVGNRFLSQEEFDAENDWKWAFGLFVVGAVVTGILVNHFLVNPLWHQAIRFGITTVPAIIAGVILVKLRVYIQILISIAILLAAAAFIIALIASLV